MKRIGTPGSTGVELLALRLSRQLIEPHRGVSGARPTDVVATLCALQAQDYAGALWSVGLRSGADCVLEDVERALAQRRIVRTWPMRGTLHLVAPADVRWMLALLSPRILARAKPRHEQLGITPETISQSRAVITEALAGGSALTRRGIMELLEASGVETTGQRGYHILWTLAQQAVLCFGPMDGKQQTFVLLDEWVPPVERDPVDSCAIFTTLAGRYFEARGPATVADFAWWAGITKSEARGGVEALGSRLERLVVDGIEYWLPDGTAHEWPNPSTSVHLLPGFDEYSLGYKDRTLQLGSSRADYPATISANGMFSATLVIGGRIAGVWKRTLRRDRVDIAVNAFRRLTAAERAGLLAAAERYGRFLGRTSNVTV